MNKITGLCFTIGLIIIGGLLRYIIADNALNHIAKNGETSCIRGNLERIIPIQQCEIYKFKMQSIEFPNCYTGKTTYAVVKIMREARNNGCTVN